MYNIYHNLKRHASLLYKKSEKSYIPQIFGAAKDVPFSRDLWFLLPSFAGSKISVPSDVVRK
ncbi:MAG: hypothetical protein CO093_06555 [Alphaproteobacteria bacterium CG_4_9_14_3_um_filter_47_13]|nr:MAG: hypothetical protein CO093_06555 [Alphaproteobacteria bacterium CG_4_9_14_3_um_filter_47_13]